LIRIKAVIAYDGGFFSGFQRQKSTPDTVSHRIEVALKSLNIDSSIIGSGRTDAGVHASGQVISFELPDYWSDLERLSRELNRKLKHIYIKRLTLVDGDFHARFSAKRRIYRYVFKRRKPSVFEERYISHYSSFNQYILEEALSLFEGKHDFKFFHKTGSVVHTTVREIYRARYAQRGDYHFIYFEANGFLRAQVRMMVESALLSADDRLSLNYLKEQIDGVERHLNTLAKPEGLYLARVIY